MKLASGFFALALALAWNSKTATAQTAPATAKSGADAAAVKPAQDSTAKSAPATPSRCQTEQVGTERTFYLNNTFQIADANEIVTAMRNILDSCDRIFLLSSQNAIVMRASPENTLLAQKLLNDLDRPRKNYRLTYTVTELDGSKSLGTQHFAMIVTPGQATSLKLGSKIPIATGSYSAGGSGATPGQTQFTYLDVGMNFDATLDEFANGVRLRSAVEQSSVAPEPSVIAGVSEPVIRQTSLKGESLLAPGKPLVLGSIDIPGSTSHMEIEVVMAQLP
jgi:type II secretory pathway component GspD/PulD (secretin)